MAALTRLEGMRYLRSYQKGDREGWNDDSPCNNENSFEEKVGLIFWSGAAVCTNMHRRRYGRANWLDFASITLATPGPSLACTEVWPS